MALEVKLDGYRAIAAKADGRVNLLSRRHKSFNHQYPHIVEALGELPGGEPSSMILLDRLIVGRMDGYAQTPFLVGRPST